MLPQRANSMKPKDKITIYDVANHAGVAISTVSRVLNNSSEVSEITRKKIMQAIDTLQFKPDRTAKSLAQNRKQSLSVAVPSFTSYFFNELLKGVKDTLSDKDLDMLLCNLGSSNPYERLLRFLSQGSLDALLLASATIEPKITHELMMLNAPVILLGVEAPEFDCFVWDYGKATELAMRHLIYQGHRHIGLLTGVDSHPYSVAAKDMFRRMLSEHGMSFEESLIQTGSTTKHAGLSEEAGYESVQKLLSLNPQVTAVFAPNDALAIGAWSALRGMGKSVPKEVALIGCDDIKVSKFIGLTSIKQNMFDVGTRATELALARIGDRKSPPKLHYIKPELCIRQSCL